MNTQWTRQENETNMAGLKEDVICFWLMFGYMFKACACVYIKMKTNQMTLMTKTGHTEERDPGERRWTAQSTFG